MSWRNLERRIQTRHIIAAAVTLGFLVLWPRATIVFLLGAAFGSAVIRYIWRGRDERKGP
jgi:hypothetical protein